MSGDPFCLVFPQARPIPVPELGREVRFTGTFLKMVRYAAHDGPRLAPLIVGDTPPASAVLGGNGGHRANPVTSLDHWSWSLATWSLGLSVAALLGGVLARWHLNTLSRKPARDCDDPSCQRPAAGIHRARR